MTILNAFSTENAISQRKKWICVPLSLSVPLFFSLINSHTPYPYFYPHPYLYVYPYTHFQQETKISLLSPPFLFSFFSIALPLSSYFSTLAVDLMSAYGRMPPGTYTPPTISLCLEEKYTLLPPPVICLHTSSSLYVWMYVYVCVSIYVCMYVWQYMM